jgi:hypothetical protein
MKKLLFIPVFGLLAWLGSCSYSAIVQPSPSAIIRQAHEAFPSAPVLPKITVPDFKPQQPKVTHVRPSKPRAYVPPPVPYVAEEPAVAGPECIWPLRLIPGCRPQQ